MRKLLRAHSVLPLKLTEPVPIVPEKEAAEATVGFLPASYLGTRAGLIERWRLDELTPGHGYDVYRKMAADDAITAALSLTIAGVLSRTWRLEVDDGDEKRKKAARTLDFLLRKRLQGSIAGLIRLLIVGSRTNGFAPVEKLWGPTAYGGKTWWTLNAYKLRDCRSLSVVSDKYGNVQGIRQRTDTGGVLEIDPRRFLWHVYRPEADPDYGRSALVGAYKHWFAKEHILRLRNIYIERVAGGFVSIQTREGDPSKFKNIHLTTGDRDTLNQMVTNWQSTMGAVLPAGYEAVVEVPGSTDAFDNAEASCNKGISRAMLQPNLLGFAEQGDYGSRGQSATQFDAWAMLLDMDCQEIANLFNEGLLPELMLWNFGEGLEPPTFVFDPLTPDKRAELAGKWADAVQKGAVRNTYEDELKTRSLYGYPERAEDEAPAGMTDPMRNEESAQVPDERGPGYNPITTARRRQQLFALERQASDQIEREVYSALGGEWGQLATAIVRRAWGALVADLRLQVRPQVPGGIGQDLREQAEAAIFDLYRRTWQKAQRDAAREIGRATFTLAEDQVLDWLRKNAERFVTDLFDAKMIKALENVLSSGIANGTDVEMIISEAERVLQPLIGDRIAEGWSAPTPAQIATAVRTVLTTVYNQGRKAFFEDPRMRGYVQAYRFSAVLDDRTTEVCRAMDGKTWPVDDPRWKQYTPALHFNCRSILFPVTVEDEWETSPGTDVQPAPGFGT